ncbi:MAG: HU family DNA-binding protein [Phocaeicola sp.]|uniref:HU family DNA-binding protein n=1 Tax=Phocaeicola TaxID=909656 RepID=UPI00234F28A0|nr:HU family DNA-binding protein [Phocaeicola oris]MCE2615408.1 HU family DNA-binding protein [Phocaeicola oris]
MNNKEFIAELSKRSNLSVKETNNLVSSFIDLLSDELQNGDSITLNNFGTFEVKKKLERISVNPISRQRMLIPPKLVVNFRPSTFLKEKFK